MSITKPSLSLAPCLIFVLILIRTHALGQTVDIFIDTRVSGYPNNAVAQSNYQSAGFTTVNITSGLIDASVSTLNYDVLIINENYTYNSSLGAYVPDFLTPAQQAIAQTFVSNGGHIIWIAESWDTSPITGGPTPQSSSMLTTVNSVFGQSVAYGPYFNNGGMGSPNMPRVHPSNGPGGLSPSSSILSSGSYATLINVPSENAVYAPDFFSNFIFFDECIHTTVALFPAFPTNSNGSIIVSSEVATPFFGYNNSPLPIFPPPPLNYNTAFDQAVATLHFNLITNGSMTAINSWSSVPGSTNIDCEPIILPVELLEFNANYSKSDSRVYLNWQTASEKDSDNFEVERSSNMSEWEVVDLVDASGHSEALLEYSSIDPDPLYETSYYRLRLNDINGAYSYSNVRTIRRMGSLETSIYPNPATDNIKIIGEFDSDTKIEIISNIGQILKQFHSIDIGATEIEISTENLCLGTYYVRITSHDSMVNLPFVILE